MSDKRTKVVFLINSLGGGGAEKIMTMLVENIDPQRFEVSLFLTMEDLMAYHLREDIVVGYHNPEQVKVKPLASLLLSVLALGRTLIPVLGLSKHSIGYRVVLANITELYRCYLSTKQYLQKSKPDVVVSFLFHSTFIAILCKMFSRHKFRVVCSDHCTLTQELKNYFPYSYLFLPRLLFRRLDAYAAVSSGVARDLVENYQVPESKLQVIYNGVDLGLIARSAALPLEAELEGLFSGDGTFAIVNVGRLAPPKSQHFLLDAFQKVREQIPCCLYLIGTGELRLELQQRAAQLGIDKDVHFLGWRSNPFNIMKRCDLFVLTSSWEAFPNVLIEAMAVGLPIVSTDCPTGPREALDGGRFGELVPVGDVDAIASAIVRLYRDSMRRVELARLGQERSRSFSLPLMVSKYEQIISELAVQVAP